MSATKLNVVKVALCTFLAIASNVGSTSGIGVTIASTRGTISTTLDLGILGTRPLISLHFLISRELAMSEWTLVGLGAFSPGELKAGPGILRRVTRGRMSILTLSVTLRIRFSLTFAFAFPLDVSLGRRSNVGSWSCDGALSVRVMSVATLGSLSATTLVHPLGTMLLVRVCQSSSRGPTRESGLDSFLVLTLTSNRNLSVSLGHQVTICTRFITRIGRVIGIESVLHTIAIAQLFKDVFPQEVLVN